MTSQTKTAAIIKLAGLNELLVYRDPYDGAITLATFTEGEHGNITPQLFLCTFEQDGRIHIHPNQPYEISLIAEIKLQ